jgi:hypothetical protein
MILTALGNWLLLSVLMAVACTAVLRGAHREDQRRGYVSDRR